VEDTTKSAIETFQPVVDMLEGPINAADTLCCKGLDMLEEAFPAVHNEPHEVKSFLYIQYFLPSHALEFFYEESTEVYPWTCILMESTKFYPWTSIILLNLL
jgi:hypothetical protein